MVCCPCIPHNGRQCIGNCCGAFFAISVTLGIPLVILICGPVVHSVSVTVENATLSTFTLATPPPLPPVTTTPPPPPAAVVVTYNLSMTVRVHNPNQHLSVDFAAPLEVRYNFDGALFGPHFWLTVEGQKLPARNTVVYCLTLGAVNETVPGLDVDSVADFARQSSAGVFEVDVLVAGRYTVRGAKRSLAATCPLKLHLGTPPAATGKQVKCV